MADFEALIPFLPARDLDRTQTFYSEGLGLRLVLDQGRCRVFEVTETAYVGFCQSETLPHKGRIILTLVVPDPDRSHAELVAAGLAPEPVEEVEEFRIRRFFVADPDGYLVEFQRFWNRDWRRGGRTAGSEPRS